MSSIPPVTYFCLQIFVIYLGDLYMKFILSSLTLLLTFSASASANVAAPLILSGSDCYVGIQTDICSSSLYLPGCQWGSFSSGYWKPMQLVSAEALTFTDTE